MLFNLETEEGGLGITNIENQLIQKLNSWIKEQHKTAKRSQQRLVNTSKDTQPPPPPPPFENILCVFSTLAKPNKHQRLGQIKVKRLEERNGSNIIIKQTQSARRF